MIKSILLSIVSLLVVSSNMCALSKVKKPEPEKTSNEFINPLPERCEVLKTTLFVNRYFMMKYADYRLPSYVRNVMRPSNIWTRSVYYEGLMSLYSIFPEEEFYNYAFDWADYHNWNFRKGATTRNADNYCASQIYIDLYRLNGQIELLRHVKANMNMYLNTPQVDDWTWIDAIQMGMPVFAKMGKEFNDTRYFDKMWQMYSCTRNEIGGGLYNPKDGLWWRDADFVPPYKEPNGKDCYWSRGNGWVYLALIRVLDEIPVNEMHRVDYLADFKAMSEGLRKCQREDGYWNVSLLCEENYGGKEVTGTSLFICGMAWGVRNGILDKETYMPIIAKAWNAIVNEAVRKNGSLGFVQGTGKEPKDGQPVTYDSMPDFEDFAIGCFLLAGTEIYKIAK